MDATFVLKLDPAGNFVWAKGFTGTNYCRGVDIKIDGSSNVVISGAFQGTIDFDPGFPAVFRSSTKLRNDLFITKLNVNGDFIFVKTIKSGTSSIVSKSIAIDQLDNIYTSGYFFGDIDVNPSLQIDTLSSKGKSDVFILKLDSLGNYINSVRIGGKLSDYAKELSIDQFGDLYLAGIFEDSTDLNTDSVIVRIGMNDIFIQKLDGNLHFISAFSIGGKYDDTVESIKVVNESKVYFGGYFSDTVDFNFNNKSDIIVSNGSSDGFLSIFSSCALDTSVTRDGFQLESNQLNSTYQWLDCAKGFTKLLNDTSRQFLPILNGLYMVLPIFRTCVS